jgi:2,3-bisphosphoglycerate-dependent phosphoglycerate mutase
MTTVHLIRHGDYRDGPEREGGPLRDLGLTEEGRAQAHRLRERLMADKLLKADVLLSSTERRALETAEIVASALGLPVTPDRDLEEWRSDDGTIPADKFMAQWKQLSERERPFHRFQPDSETGIEFTTRVHSALHRLIRAHEGKRLALMTHGGVIQAAFQFFFGYGDAAFRRAYPAAGHTSITGWRSEAAASGGERWVLDFSNDRAHLSS